jgi:hypothetical protein
MRISDKPRLTDIITKTILIIEPSGLTPDKSDGSLNIITEKENVLSH